MWGQMEVVVSEAAGASRVAAPAEVAPGTTGVSDIMPASGPTTASAASGTSEPRNISELSDAELSSASESSAPSSAMSGLANPNGSSMV